ncbi:hypothetical protein RRF57_002344 [Xylaria bambusicola]|uniref:Uncharacterized protein n=1 Tax=Xylaria bambusicola TaxID=326684 RepID=A0AAN7USP1_9PEZI
MHIFEGRFQNGLGISASQVRRGADEYIAASPDQYSIEDAPPNLKARQSSEFGSTEAKATDGRTDTQGQGSRPCEETHGARHWSRQKRASTSRCGRLFHQNAAIVQTCQALLTLQVIIIFDSTDVHGLKSVKHELFLHVRRLSSHPMSIDLQCRSMEGGKK